MSQDMISQSRLQRGYNPAITWVRMLVIGLIAMGHVSTIPHGPGSKEFLYQFGYDPSWLGVNALFMIAGFLAMTSLRRHGNALHLLTSKVARNLPVMIIYVAAITLLLFPIFGIKPNNFSNITSHLAVYAFDVLTCLDPGRKLEGLLDNAKYECVIQGAIWTFRWGLVAYIGAAIGWKIGILKSVKMLYIITSLALIAYVVVHAAVVWRGINLPDSVTTALRLGWPFLAGMSLYTLKDTLPKTWAIPAVTAVLAAIHYLMLPWSPLTEVLATIFWGYSAILLMSYDGTKLPKAMQNVPDLSLGLYIFHWPAAQILLLLAPNSGSLALFALTAPVTILLSWLVWKAVQHPLAMRRQSQFASVRHV